MFPTTPEELFMMIGEREFNNYRLRELNKQQVQEIERLRAELKDASDQIEHRRREDERGRVLPFEAQ